MNVGGTVGSDVGVTVGGSGVLVGTGVDVAKSSLSGSENADGGVAVGSMIEITGGGGVGLAVGRTVTATAG